MARGSGNTFFNLDAVHLVTMAVGLALVTWALTGCGAPPADEAPVAALTAPIVDRTCDPPKDLAQVMRIITQTPDDGEDFGCVTDDSCPCGSFCEQGFCTARCVTVSDPDYGCAQGEVCTNYGKCEAPTAPPPTEVLTLEPSTSLVEVVAPAPGGTNFSEATVVVELRGDATPPAAPKIYVRGASVLTLSCPGGAESCDDPDDSRVGELQVKCDPAAADFSSDCVLDNWVFTPIDPANPGLGKKATREVRLRPRAGAQAATWELRLTADGKIAKPRSVSVVRRGAAQPLDGDYSGRLVLSRRGAPVVVADPTLALDAGPPSPAAAPADLAVHVTATVAGGTVLLVDPTRLVGPSGKLRLGNPDSQSAIAWLANDGGTLTGQLSVGAREHDAVRGHLRVRFTLGLPMHDGDAAVTFDGLVDLDRAGDVSAPVCGTGNTCAPGAACDTVLGRCLPGAAFVASTDSVANGMAFPDLWSWASVVQAQLSALGLSGDVVTADVMERLQCYRAEGWDVAASPPNAVLGANVMAKTGDQKCDLPGATYPTGLPLLNLIDAAGTSATASSETVAQMLATCKDDLALRSDTPSPLPTTKCLSNGRVLTAIAQALSVADPVRIDRRTAALLQHLVRGWATVVSFTAQQGLEAVDLGDADQNIADLDTLSLLDSFDRVWALVTDGTVADALATLPPRRLATPDYRGTNRPRLYFIGSSTVASEGSATLTAQPDCGVRLPCTMQATTIDPAQIDLSGDLSVAFELGEVARNQTIGPVERPVVDSPWVSVSEVSSGDLRDLGYERVFSAADGHNYTYWSGDWTGCRSLCLSGSAAQQLVQTCRGWTYWKNAGEQYGHCTLAEGPGTQVAHAGYVSGAFLDGQPRVPTYTAFARRTGTVKASSAGSQVDCYEACFNDPTCKALNWTVGATFPAGTCQLVTAPSSLLSVPGSPEVLTMDMPTAELRVSHLDRQGQPTVVTPYTLQRDTGTRRVLVTRTAGRYRAYQNGVPLPIPGTGLGGVVLEPLNRGKTSATSSLVGGIHLPPGWGPDYASAALAPPRRGAPSRFWASRGGARTAAHLAIFDTALDGIEAKAMNTRAQMGQNMSKYVTRTAIAFPEPTTTKNRDQRTELGTSLAEAFVPELRLLGSYLAKVQGSVYGECVAHQSTALRDQVQDRFGRTLRTAVFIEELAGRLHDRARQVECDSDAGCPSGTTCGVKQTATIDARTGTRTGKMRLCAGTFKNDGTPLETGLCVPRLGDPAANGGLGGNGATVAGTVGTVALTVNLPVAGSYALWTRVLAQNDAHSFWVRVDGGAWQVWDAAISTPYEWTWSLIPGGPYTLSAGPHTITVGVRDDGTVLRELVATTMTSGAPPDDLRTICYAGTTPYLAPPVGADALATQRAWTQAQTNLDAAMQTAAVQAATLGDCKNPLGIGENDLPLFFSPYTQGGDAPAALYFAASLYLHGLADAAVQAADNAFTQVETSWTNLQNQKFQAETLATQNQQRLDGIASRYSDQLEDLCGTSSAGPGGLLADFMNGTRPAALCFVKPGAMAGGSETCLQNLDRPIAEAAAGCYTGTIGQAILGMKTAHLAIDAALVNWQSKQDQYEAQDKQCAFMQNTSDIIQKHIDHMASLREKKSLFDKVAGIVSGVAGLATGVGAAAAAVNAFGHIGDTLANGSKVGWSDGLGPTGQFLGIASGLLGLGSSLTTGEKIQKEQTEFENEMALRKNQLDIMQCFAIADRLRDEINLSAIAVQQATSEFEQATMQFANRRARVDQLVAEGTAEVQREAERSVSLPYHRYWLDRNIQRYQRKLTWARRAVYLYMRAAEYDLQMSLGLRDEILDARNVQQLDSAFDAIHESLAHNRIGPANVTPNNRVLFLSMRKILGLPLSDDTTIGRLLSSPASNIYDAHGQLLGRGIRFQLNPTSRFLLNDPESSLVPNDCAEHITRFTGSIQAIDPAGHPYIPFEIWQENDFASQKCGPADATGHVPLVPASHWPAHNLFDDDGTSTLIEASPMTQVIIQNQANQDLRTTDPLTSAMDLMGRGLFGNYVLFISSGTLATLNASKVTDVTFRIDYTAGSNGTSPH